MEVEVRSPFPVECLPRLWSWISGFREKIADDFAPQTLEEFVSQMSEKWDRQKSWAVCANGEIGGLITFERLTPWLGTAHLVLKPDFQGKGIGVKACRIAVAEMFSTGVGKLVFQPLAGNLAVCSLIVNLGGKREGRLTGNTLSHGKPVDMLIYGLSKEDFQHAIPGSNTVGRSFNRISGDRSGLIDSGRGIVGPVENGVSERHDDAHILAPGTAAHGPVDAVLGLLGGEPDVNPRSNAGSRSRPDQPPV